MNNKILRTFKENLIVGYAGRYMMINLISFRRKIISREDFNMLKNINIKKITDFTEKEKSFINLLYEEKQLLNDELIAWYDKQRELTFNKPSCNISCITINLTYNCNFQCKYCYQRGFKHKGEQLTIKDINSIYDFVQNYNKLHNELNSLKDVIISGGESLLESNIDSINEILYKFSGSKFKLFTNGVNIIKFAKKIDYSKFNEIQVSLDGTNEVIKTLNRNNQNPFHKITEGILLLANMGIKVSIISMVTKETLPHIGDFLEQLESKKILNNENISLRFSFVVNYGEKYSLDPSFYSPEEYLNVRHEILKLIQDKKNITVDGLYDLLSLQKVINRKQNERLDGRIAMCNTAKGFPVLVGPDHGVFWCTCTNMKNKLCSFDNSPEELDKNQLFQELLHRNIYKMDKCKKCIYRFVCSAGCPLYAIHCNDSANTYHCGIFEHPLFEEKAELFLGM